MERVNSIIEFLFRTKRKKGRKKLRKNKSKGERFSARLDEGLSILKSPLKRKHWKNGKRSRGRNRQ